MLAQRQFCSTLVLLFSLTFLSTTSAQTLPGVEIADTSVSQNAITLIKLAQQAHPALFSQATPWRTFDGFHYKYFAGSGVYVGINGNDLYLLGGSFGNTVSYQGSVTGAITAVQGMLGTSAQPFQDYITASKLLDLIGYFRKLTLSYGSGIAIGNSAPLTTDASVTLEVVGADTVSGAATQRLKVTIKGTNVSTPIIYDMWVNAQGTVVRLAMNGFEYSAAQATLIGPGLVSGMLLALQAAETPTVKAAISGALANNGAVSQNTQNRTIGGLPVQTLTITISDTASASMSLELSDLGPFSMATKMNSRLSSMTSYFEITEAVLR
ncbi:MAG: hypothetical protein V4751_12700 [Pseudomonadota bacterium]